MRDSGGSLDCPLEVVLKVQMKEFCGRDLSASFPPFRHSLRKLGKKYARGCSR
jgi:hypothetical protein